jgi:ubiquinone/menaquinone biosynthesis C-methylase UbiE
VFWQVIVLSQQKSSAEGYWDRVAEETRSKGNLELGKDWVGFKNWVAEYADMKTKDFLLKTLERFIVLPKTAKILDVGCGPGKWTKMYAEKGFLTTGIDASSGMVQLARAGKKDMKKVNLSVMDASSLGFQDASFDLVNCVTVLQHITVDEKWKKAIKEIVRVTKPKGNILLYEMAPFFTLSRGLQSVRIRTWKEYETEFARRGARLVFALATDISFPLTILSLRKYSTTFARNEAYFYWTRRKKKLSLAQIASLSSKIIATFARQIDYKLAETPLGMASPLRILLVKKTYR